MTFRLFSLTCLLLILVSLLISFLWVQTVLPGAATLDPWGQQIRLIPTVFSIWLPAIFFFFTSVWLYLAPKLPNAYEKHFLRYDFYSYFSIIAFFWLQIIQKELLFPIATFKTLILGILVVKAFLLFRALYHQPQLIQPALLFVLTLGLYLLSMPFLQLSPEFELSVLLHHSVLGQIGIISLKAIALSAMMLESFRLSVAMTKSVKSAFFSWLAIAFSFPVMIFPKLNVILAGLFLIFVLRMLLSRVDTHELIRGLLEPARLAIALKLAIVIALLGAAGLIFWSNVKPGFGIQVERAYEAGIGSLFNGQYGLLSYSPMYWLAFCGILYFLYFKAWEGIVLISTGGILYVVYHFISYGMFAKIPLQYDCIPFIPFLGVFLATAHQRFGKNPIFRTCVRLLLFSTLIVSSILLLAFPENSTIPGKLSQWQHLLFTLSGRDISILLPSLPFNLFPIASVLTLGLISLFTLGSCYLRTHPFTRAKLRRTHRGKTERGATLIPAVLLLILLGTTVFFHCAPRLHPLQQGKDIQLSQTDEQLVIPVSSATEGSRRYRGILLVSNLRNSVAIPHRTPIANVTVSETQQQFESFVMKAGRDTSEEVLDSPYITPSIEHGRAAVFRSQLQRSDDGTPFEAHEYYSRYMFSKARKLEQISVKLLDAEDLELPPGIQLHIKEIFLLDWCFDNM